MPGLVRVAGNPRDAKGANPLIPRVAKIIVLCNGEFRESSRDQRPVAVMVSNA